METRGRRRGARRDAVRAEPEPDSPGPDTFDPLEGDDRHAAAGGVVDDRGGSRGSPRPPTSSVAQHGGQEEETVAVDEWWQSWHTSSSGVAATIPSRQHVDPLAGDGVRRGGGGASATTLGRDCPVAAADTGRAPGRGPSARAVRRRLAQREFALAAVALLAAVDRARGRGEDPQQLERPPRRRTAPIRRRPAPAGPASFGKHTACGTIIRAKTEGVAHPVLPCGARIYITYNGKHVLTQVIDRGPSRADREFELTDALAQAPRPNRRPAHPLELRAPTELTGYSAARARPRSRGRAPCRTNAT